MSGGLRSIPDKPRDTHPAIPGRPFPLHPGLSSVSTEPRLDLKKRRGSCASRRTSGERPRQENQAPGASPRGEPSRPCPAGASAAALGALSGRGPPGEGAAAARCPASPEGSARRRRGKAPAFRPRRPWVPNTRGDLGPRRGHRTKPLEVSGCTRADPRARARSGELEAEAGTAPPLQAPGAKELVPRGTQNGASGGGRDCTSRPGSYHLGLARWIPFTVRAIQKPAA